MAELFGIRPWETDLLTVADFDLVVGVCEYVRDQRVKGGE